MFFEGDNNKESSPVRENREEVSDKSVNPKAFLREEVDLREDLAKMFSPSDTSDGVYYESEQCPEESRDQSKRSSKRLH